MAAAVAAVRCDSTKNSAENREAEAARRAAVAVQGAAAAAAAAVLPPALPGQARRPAARPIEAEMRPSPRTAGRSLFACVICRHAAATHPSRTACSTSTKSTGK